MTALEILLLAFFLIFLVLMLGKMDRKIKTTRATKEKRHGKAS